MLGIRTTVAALGLLSLLLGPAPGRAQVIAYGPVVGSVPDGVLMNVTPVVSADRRYVRMTINPRFINVQGFDSFVIPGAVGGGGNGGLGGGGGVGGAFVERGAGLGGATFNGPHATGYAEMYGRSGLRWGGGYHPLVGEGLGTLRPAATTNAMGSLAGVIRQSTGRRRGWR